MGNNERGKYLAKNTIIFTLGNLGTKLIQFFLVPLYTNVLSTADYGVVDLVTTIGMVLAPILLLNINDGVMRFALDKGADFNKIMSIGLAAFIFCLITGLVIFPIGNISNQLGNYSSYIYFYTISYAGNLLFFGYLRGTEKLLQFSIGNIINAMLIASFNIFFLVIIKTGIAGYFLSYTLANFICCIYAFIVGNVKEVILNFKLDKELMIKMLKYSVVLIPNTFMWWIINSSDRVMITSFIGNSANGIYAISCKIPTLLSTIVTIFNTAWSYSAIKENDSYDRDEYNNSVYNGLVMLSVVIGAAMMLVMKPFLAVYVSKMYYKAWMFTPYLVVGCVFLSIASFLGAYYTVNKDSKGFLYSSSVAAAINLALNYLLIPKIGIAGAALATAISYIAVFLYRAVDTKKYIFINVFSKKHLVSYILLMLIGCSMFIEGLMSYLLMIIIYIVILIIYKETWWMYVISLKQILENKLKK
ncbi:MAG: oligosaccharide flippase family protein [Faecalibacillus intestinalis]|uniref:oligosaccharide flippase family protein n=1 Tax=Bacillota TaxID=1239 RepID=UPI0039673D02